VADLRSIDYQLQVLAHLAEAKRKLGSGRWRTISGAKVFIPDNPKEPVIGPGWIKYRIEAARPKKKRK